MNRLPALLVLASTLLACGSSDDGPSSAHALRKAEPLKSSCSYTLKITTFFNGTVGKSEQALCIELPCSTLGETDVTSGVAGDSVLTGVTEYADRVDAIGSCDALTPVTCTVYTDSTSCELCIVKSCCAPSFRCENDPNCQAVVQCLARCAKDESCGKECRRNGEPTAVANLAELTECLADHCTATCK